MAPRYQEGPWFEKVHPPDRCKPSLHALLESRSYRTRSNVATVSYLLCVIFKIFTLIFLTNLLFSNLMISRLGYRRAIIYRRFLTVDS